MMDTGFRVRLKQLRMQQDISLRKLGEKAGVSYSILNSIENGRFQPSRETVIALAHALRYEPITELLVLSGYVDEV
ncbi:helix-turn-helix transcriptional regulator [Paenibacillus sp. UNC451MF]|uniref:helix-turn-helix transcriptional regulator n=1 Tax=Paenibacillus sp. UNC451MF TaxID=1449063 RepID=UPI0005666B50|nr:helix-turn-helix transcriptional regulator [Paenibacillus sp. UNC451MF]